MLLFFAVLSGIFGVVPESVGVLIVGVGLVAATFALRRLFSGGRRATDLTDATETRNRRS